MSENLELVRSLSEAWGRGNFSSTAWAHRDIEVVFVDGPEPGVWTGVAGMVVGFRRQLQAWDGYRVEADEYREIDAERILVLVHSGGRGKASGLELAEVRRREANLFHVRGQAVTKLVIYWDADRALADLGLAE